MAERGGRPYTPSTLELLEEARGQDHCDERACTALA
jgi:hypothetical protein